MTTRAWNLPETMGNGGITGGNAAAQDRQEERAWLDRCAQGDEKAIRWVLQRYRARVVRLAGHILLNPCEAEDVAQEAFVKAFRSIRQFRGESGFYAWLYRIVLNLCRDRMRRKGIMTETPLDSTHATLVAYTPDIEQQVVVRQVLNALPPAMRALLILREVEGMEYSELAEVLNIPIGTVKSRLHAAREQFRQRWTAIQEEADHV